MELILAIFEKKIVEKLGDYDKCDEDHEST